MDQSRISYLIERYLDDTASSDELMELENLLADPNADGIVKEVLYSFYQDVQVSEVANSAAKERIFQQIVDHPQRQSAESASLKWRRWLPYAAVVLLSVSVGLLIWQAGQDTTPREISAAEIAPGANRATLSLGGGRTIALDESHRGIVVGKGEITYSDGTSEVTSLEDGASIERLVLSIPKGGTYAVTLPDSSTVWLNSASTLTYPSRFDDRERVVFLEGEAYFEVRQSRGRPFRVVSAGQVVEVLGTEFAISAYADESEVRTTLVKGRVQVSANGGVTASEAASGGKPRMLKPGEQAVNHAGTIDVRNVDVNPYTAWKDGLFYFDRSSPQAAIAQLARWYDLEVTYQGKLPQVPIFGVIDRNKPLASVLKSLEKTGLKFSVTQTEGINRLTVLGEQ